VVDLLDPAEMLRWELAERREAGYDVEDLEGDVGRALDAGSVEEIERTHVCLEATSVRLDWPYEEPSTLEEIRRTLPPAPEPPPLTLDDEACSTGCWVRGSGGAPAATSASPSRAGPARRSGDT